ncbi:MAG: hypothetical protein ACAI35_23030 [Candidatus Methylacidiphilales bacterium]|nr:hypothetical protein [Candidatus Methylacidiphilales bacterium]
MKALLSAACFGTALLFSALGPASVCHAADPVPLMESSLDNFGWKFDNGREFPGAKGGISVDQEVTYKDKPTLKLVGDFTEGGAYVRTAGVFAAGDITEVSFWIKNPRLTNLTLRLLDSTRQCHQFTLKIEPGTDWQQVVFKPQQYFAKDGAMDGNKVVRYQSWGGSADKEWHGAAGTMDIIIGKPPVEHDSSLVSELWIAEVTVTPKS